MNRLAPEQLAAGVQDLQVLYTYELDQCAYISQTLRADETAD